ncbi:Essential recombination function protein [uncultured Caudovirales phage]|uniref:Essential recombination function protein n=1 Tax=uncultured Caudovirales phage TaxID=2100421 RepID=A0A6J5QLM5_9CAUD|nr:Essential recombination function protein [uncultured Caudovirales phage]CAB4182381.1 Essential recombination function protein [uncultured Caudovirales phage]CAB4213941.1 Essential recombination function protein [uncultured Caudovirales phage]CAB5228424.1 Essential recombination function protein [uncultured Caudovirales phage]
MSGELITQEQENRPAVVSEQTSLLSIIERASRDSTVDIDKMERLMQMHERMMDKKAESEFNDALVACQGECGRISADANNPQTRSKYATYAKLDSVLRPIYTRHGIAISYNTEDSPKPEHIRVTAHVSRKGYTRMYRVDMPADGKGAKGGDVMTKTHAAGSAMSYGARYLLKGIFNISIGEHDDDGNGAGNMRRMTEQAKADWHAAIEGCSDEAAAKAMWQKVAQSTTAAGDVEAHEQLRAALTAKLKSLKSAKVAI